MLHTLAALMPFAPGDRTTPGPQMPTATVTVTAPAPVPSPAATVPGWKRFSVAEQELAAKTQTSDTGLERDFQTFVRQSGVGVRTEADREALFRNFLNWRDRQAGRRQ